jgi:HlyD family secretion protein
LAAGFGIVNLIFFGLKYNNKINMKFNKKILILTVIFAIAGWLIYSALKPKGPVYTTVAVVRGDIVQEVSETGTVKKGDILVLNFKNSGTIDKIAVGKGDAIQAGQILAQLNTDQLQVQLRQAKANLDLYRIQRDKLMNGASDEDITLAQTAVINAQAARDSASQALSDAKDGADQKLSNLYDAASDTLNSARAKAVNAGNSASLLQRTYFTPQD